MTIELRLTLLGHDLICQQTEITEETRVQVLPPTYCWMQDCPFDWYAKATGVPRPMSLDIALSSICSVKIWKEETKKKGNSVADFKDQN